jgi:hypothetical protein
LRRKWTILLNVIWSNLELRVFHFIREISKAPGYLLSLSRSARIVQKLLFPRLAESRRSMEDGKDTPQRLRNRRVTYVYYLP